MFKSLKFNFTIMSGIKAGRTFTGDYNFEGGMTGFFGDNEAGKSLRFEMLRFSLFGSKALRGASDDYKKMNVECGFVIKDEEFFVRRSIKSAELFYNVNGNLNPIASGTKPVNEAILRKLGYGMDVFDTANACLQGETEALTSMKPTARKQMVDNILGLNCLDKLAALYAEKAKIAKAGIDALTGMMTEPVRPEDPVAFVLPASDLLPKITKLEADSSRHDILIAELAALYTAEPTYPDLPTMTRSMEEVIELRGLYKNAAAEVVDLKNSLLNISVKTLDERPNSERIDLLQAYLDRRMPVLWAAYNAYLKDQQALPQLTLELTKEESHEMLLSFDRQDAEKKAEALRCSSEVNCPHCQKAFSLQQQSIDAILIPVQDLPQISTEGFTRKAVEAHLIALSKIDLFEEKWGLEDYTDPFGDVPTMEHIDRSEADIKRELDTLKSEAEKYDLYQEVKAKLELAEQRVKAVGYNPVELDMWQDINAKEAAYKAQLAKYEAYKTRRAEIEPELETLILAKADLTAARQLYQVSLVFEQQMISYTDQKKRYQDAAAKLETMTAEMDKLNIIRKGLIDLKPKVKSYLMPSLNTVASNFLAQMTSGVRNSIYIDNEFDILVDGQRVETLSGSGKAVVNLAIRIALGTVLTNKIFSVFMVDEADAAMRGERASYTAECLRNLRKTIKQIFIISHKDIEVDTRILV